MLRSVATVMQKREEMRVHEVSEDPGCTYGKLFKPPPLANGLD
jgi:hypothetical protein